MQLAQDADPTSFSDTSTNQNSAGAQDADHGATVFEEVSVP